MGDNLQVHISASLHSQEQENILKKKKSVESKAPESQYNESGKSMVEHKLSSKSAFSSLIGKKKDKLKIHIGGQVSN